MILLDTNVIVDVTSDDSPLKSWATDLIVEAVAEGGEGAAINAITLAELCAHDGTDENAVAGAVLDMGIIILPLPQECASICGVAYRAYLKNRKESVGKNAPKTPLPDFFIGAHAQSSKFRLATNDVARYKKYFSKVELFTP